MQEWRGNSFVALSAFVHPINRIPLETITVTNPCLIGLGREVQVFFPPSFHFYVEIGGKLWGQTAPLPCCAFVLKDWLGLTCLWDNHTVWGWGWTLTVNPISAGGLWVQGRHGSRLSPRDADKRGRVRRGNHICYLESFLRVKLIKFLLLRAIFSCSIKPQWKQPQNKVIGDKI